MHELNSDLEKIW